MDCNWLYIANSEFLLKKGAIFIYPKNTIFTKKNMKGVSAVIATILMLMITIALAGTAYLYITGIFGAKTAVVLSIDGQSTTCNVTYINAVVKNDGTGVASNVLIDLTTPGGAVTTAACSITTINAGSSSSTLCGKSAGAGSYTLRAYTTGSSTTGSVYCAS